MDRLDEKVLTASAPDVYHVLLSSPRGLTEEQAADRLQHHGANELPPAQRRPLILKLGAQFRDMFAVVLMTASAITGVAYLLQDPRDPGTAQLAVAILCVVILNAIIGFAQEYSAERTVQALQALVPQTSRVLRGGERREVAAAELVPGDVIVVEAGDSVPADARLVEANGLSVSNAALTGESAAVVRRADPMGAGVPVLEAANCVLMGTTVVAGTGKAVVFATGTTTQFGGIFRLTTETASQPTPLQRQVVVLARRVSVVALSVGMLLFAIRTATGSPLTASFVFALGVMVACVPEGLPATMSVSLAVGVRRMARQHALIKKLLAVESLGSTTVICTDKTGTLTQAEMTVQRCWAAGRYYGVSGVGYAPVGTVDDAPGVTNLLRIAALCNNARLIPATAAAPWRVLGDPTEGALLVAAMKAGIEPSKEELSTPRVTEFPFDPDRKLMTTVHRVDDGYAAYVKGSPQELLDRCEQIDWDGERRPLNDRLRAQVAAAADEMASQSLRVLGVAYGNTAEPHPEQETVEARLTFVGLTGMLDPPRPSVAEAVHACRTAGISIVMVTGDHPLTAEAIGRRVGIVAGSAPMVVTGRQLAKMSDDELGKIFAGRDELLFCRLSPEHKMRIVAVLERQGEVVAVTGDGANDAPALKRADIGVAMGASGTDVARQAAAMVLLDDSFASIVTAVEVGRSVYRNIGKFLVYVFTSNVGELMPILVATFVGFPLVPLTAVQVLAIDLGSDVLPALALGAEPPEPAVMTERPRPRREPLFTARLLRRLMFLGAFQSLGVLVAFFWTIRQSGLPFDAFTADHPVYWKAITMSHAAIVVSQVFVGLAVRSDRESVFRLGLLSNPRLVVAQCIGVGFVASVSYVPFLQSIFHTAPLGVSDWALVAAFGVLLLVADEIRKLWLRRRAERTGR